jgi:hypothetical protein
MTLRKLFLMFSAVNALLGTQAVGEVVSVTVKERNGHGFLFSGHGQCFIFLPNHVLGRSSRFNFQSSSAPASVGKAELMQAEVHSMDLAIAEVSDKTFDGCGTDWQTIISWKQPETIIGREIRLRQVPNAGQLKEIPMRVNFQTSGEFDARVSEQIAINAVQQGTSGSIAFYDDQAIGMAITATTQWDAGFLSLPVIIRAVASTLNWSLDPEPAFESDIPPSSTFSLKERVEPRSPDLPIDTYSTTISPTGTFVKEEKE